MMEGEKQGKLGNLEEMTVTQLQELLDRESKLLARPRFLQMLPDKGQKVKDFAAKLQDMIAHRQKGSLAQPKDNITETDTHPDIILTTQTNNTTLLTKNNQQSTPHSHPVRRNTNTLSDRNSLPEPNREPLGDKEAIIDSTAAELSEAIDSMVISELSAPRTTEKMVKSSDSVTEGGGDLETLRLPNSYEMVMRRQQGQGQGAASCPRKLFRPNQSLIINDIHKLPEAFKQKSRASTAKVSSSAAVNQSSDSSNRVDHSANSLEENGSQSAADSSNLKKVDQSAKRLGRVNQSSDSSSNSSGGVGGGGKKGGGSVMKASQDTAVCGPRYRFHGAREITLEESLQLQRRQKEHLERLQTLQAAERLAERLNIKTEDYLPPTLDMQYRTSRGNDDADVETKDSDDDDDALD